MSRRMPAHRSTRARPASGPRPDTLGLPDDAQETPVHLETHLTIYRRQMDDLERRLRRQCSATARGPAPRPARRRPSLHLPLHRRRPSG